jgi:hypothetical protein
VVSYLQIQSAGDTIFPRGRRYYWKARFLCELADAAIDALLAAYAAAPSESLLVLQHVGGAIARCQQGKLPTPTEMRFTIASPSRSGTIPRMTKRTSDGPAICGRRWPFSTGGVYANNLGEEGTERVQAAFGANYAKLAAVKTSTIRPTFPSESEHQAGNERSR